MPGIGEATAHSLTAELPELAAIGRPQIGRVLFMATLVATRHDPLLRQHYEHLVIVGNAKKTALVGRMRKLVVILRDQWPRHQA